MYANQARIHEQRYKYTCFIRALHPNFVGCRALHPKLHPGAPLDQDAGRDASQNQEKQKNKRKSRAVDLRSEFWVFELGCRSGAS